MRVIKDKSIWLYLGVAALLCSCSAGERPFQEENLEIRNLIATIDGGTVTRAVAELGVSVGRTGFRTDDRIVFTTIRRTSNPLTQFTYSNIRYYYYEGKSWEREEGNLPEKIYWTDGASEHTFIGYSLPATDYHWTDNGDGTYAGELGHGETELDFTSGNGAISVEDLLLDYNTKTIAETGGLSTKVSFNHALSNVRVIVNIKNFAASSGAVDTRVTVSDLRLLDQPARFTWGGDSRTLRVLDFGAAEQTVKDIRLWIPDADGEGTAQSKTFTFYGLTTPQDETFHAINGNDRPLEFSFTVTYPDPMNPTGDPLVRTYAGSFSTPVNFHSGQCTTLNISLNHKDEQMFMGVEYNDWNYVSTPDLGELRKKSTFMDITSPVTTHDMAAATADDATWLYLDGGILRDIYGNDGSMEHPFRITSSQQMLSFAHEVSGGLSFQGRYVLQDADITMQSGTSMTSAEDENSHVAPVSWIGIGDADHPFQGTYLGGNRYVNRLCGMPLFASLGFDAQVIQVQITTIGSIQGGGALTVSNAGIIGACRIADDVTADGGAIAAFNSGVIYASCHIGDTHGPAGLVTDNTGSIIGCYQAGQVNGGDPYSIAATGSGLVDCPAPSSLYQMQQEEFTGALNASLESWYQSNPNVTRFIFVHSTAGFPSIRP
jgi:hypothetical protein